MEKIRKWNLLAEKYNYTICNARWADGCFDIYKMDEDRPEIADATREDVESFLKHLAEDEKETSIYNTLGEYTDEISHIMTTWEMTKYCMEKFGYIDNCIFKCIQKLLSEGIIIEDNLL